jgi:hypothetical protein
MTIINWPGKKLSNKKKKGKTKRNIGYKTQMVMEPPNHSEIKTRRYHNTKKRRCLTSTTSWKKSKINQKSRKDRP